MLFRSAPPASQRLAAPQDRLSLPVDPDIHIAVLDDEADITRLLATYLQGRGYRVSQLHQGHALMQLMAADPPALVVQVGKTQLRYHLGCLEDLAAMLAARGDWVPLGGADEQKPAKDGTVEAWGRSPDNPIGGWYGLKKGFRGRFGVYVPPLMEALDLCELEHNPKNNRLRAK